jgi:ketosteroid isomerase-like protein
MKNLLLVAAFALGILACSKTGADNTIATKNEQIIRQYFTHFNNHDWVKMANLYIETADFRDPSLGQDVVKQTRAQTIQKYTELSKTFQNVHDDIVSLYPSGDKHIVVEFLASGTAPDGSKFQLPICTIFTIENGLITKDFTYYDNIEAPQ